MKTGNGYTRLIAIIDRADAALTGCGISGGPRRGCERRGEGRRYRERRADERGLRQATRRRAGGYGGSGSAAVAFREAEA